jgi:hypothetical protein
LASSSEGTPQDDPQDGDDLWERLEGEEPDSATRQALNLAHRAIGKVPELAQRYRRFAGPAAVLSTALTALAGIAVARRARRGQPPEKILEEVTQEEIENAANKAGRANQLRRMIWRIARRPRQRPESGSF